ncbi:MAG: prepilin-type N-terminal cleavage/methylation domain-containing protein, partial [Planctomycetota bacterium]
MSAMIVPVSIPFCTLPDPRSAAARLRRGLSLLEVILALAVLAMASAYLAQSMQLAADNAIKSRRISEAELVAESVVAQVVAGVIPAQPVTWTPYYTSYSDGQWVYQLTLVPTEVQGMLGLQVSVQQSDASVNNPGRYDLVVNRWIVDPQLGLDTPPEETGYGDEGYGGGGYGGGSTTGSAAGSGGASAAGGASGATAGAIPGGFGPGVAGGGLGPRGGAGGGPGAGAGGRGGPGAGGPGAGGRGGPGAGGAGRGGPGGPGGGGFAPGGGGRGAG